MTEPLLAEDVLLALFDLDSGTFRSEGSPLLHTLAGAVLTELVADGRIELADSRRTVRATGAAPSDELLRAPWQRLAERPADVLTLILTLGPTLRAPLVERLVDRGEISRAEHRILGIIPSSKLTLGDSGRRAELIAAVRPALVDGAEAEPRIGALAALLSASGALPALHPEIPWSAAVYTNGRRLQRGGWTAAAAGDAVTMTANAILANTLFVTATLPALLRD